MFTAVTATAEIKARGSDVVWLGVWERNARAIAFYKKYGFVERGEHVFLLGHDRQRDIVMACPVWASTEQQKKPLSRPWH